MTHDQLAQLHKSLEKDVTRTNAGASQKSGNHERRTETSDEISLGTILRRDKTYDRAF